MIHDDCFFMTADIITTDLSNRDSNSSAAVIEDPELRHDN